MAIFATAGYCPSNLPTKVGLTLHSPILRIICHGIPSGGKVQKARNMLVRMGFVSITAAVVLAAVAWTSASAEDEALRIYMDHAKILKLDRPVSKVIIGNSDVADATVADPKTIVLTGRNFGTTNLVLLDSDGNAIVDERILVSIDEGNTVRIFKSTTRTVLSCTPNCEEHASTGSSSSK